mmetsp:Transcript_55009/g.178807  ORF Transcript_55009/g.178807 Transcript_55009/m.178807 type:complete len:445 (+) Transcript_55009:138-1472(+)
MLSHSVRSALRRQPISRVAAQAAVAHGRAPGQTRDLAGVATSLQVSPDRLKINWQDGDVDKLNPTWLRERCQSGDTVDLQTLQPIVMPHHYPKELRLTDALLRDGATNLKVSFSDGHTSHFSLPKLRQELTSFRESPLQVSEYKKLQPRLWSGSEEVMPQWTHDDVVGSEAARLALVEELLTGGQALIRGVPQEDHEVVRFGQMLTTLRATNWGSCFNVRTKPDEAKKADEGEQMDLAYTPKPIGFHTDNPYRWPTPDFQALHAIEHCSCPDGEAPCEGCQVMNYMVDAYYIAELLRKEDPEAFKLLCEVEVRFENNGGDGGSALVHVAPHFELEAGDSSGHTLRAVRFSSKSGQYAPPLGAEKMAAFYRARRRFSELAHDPKYVMSLQLKPGDLLMFDNQRLLHARSSIAPTDGERWVQGCYLDRDGLWLNYERWRRRAGTTQ